MHSTNHTNHTNHTNRPARRGLGRRVPFGIVGAVVASAGLVVGAGSAGAADCALAYSPTYLGGVSVAIGDLNRDGAIDIDDYDHWVSNFGAAGTDANHDFDADGDVDGADFLVWQRGVSANDEKGPEFFVADSFSFGVEREMKESGEQGQTTDMDTDTVIVVGELQECKISVYGDAGEQTYLAVELENVQITSYQLGVLDAAGKDHDKWIIVQSTSMPIFR